MLATVISARRAASLVGVAADAVLAVGVVGEDAGGDDRAGSSPPARPGLDELRRPLQRGRELTEVEIS